MTDHSSRAQPNPRFTGTAETFSVVIDGDFSPMTRTSDLRPLTSAERRRRGGLTLLELLIVVGHRFP